MASYTTYLGLTKPDITDPASPTPFNTNFDTIDNAIATLDGYMATIDGLNTSVGNMQETVNGAVGAANAYTDQTVGNIGLVLDVINGEVV